MYTFRAAYTKKQIHLRRSRCFSRNYFPPYQSCHVFPSSANNPQFQYNPSLYRYINSDMNINIAKGYPEEINCKVSETCNVTKRNVRNVVDNQLKTSHDELRRNKFGQATTCSMFVAWWKPFSNRIGETRSLHPFIGLETNNEIIARVENVLYVYGCSTNRGDSVDSVLFALLNAAIFLLIPRPIPWDPPLRVPCTPSETHSR